MPTICIDAETLVRCSTIVSLCYLNPNVWVQFLGAYERDHVSQAVICKCVLWLSESYFDGCAIQFRDDSIYFCNVVE